MNIDKNIKKHINENKNIVVPNYISNGVDGTLESIKEEQRSLYVKRKQNKKLVISLVVACTILIVFIGNDSVQASFENTITKIENFFYEEDIDLASDYKEVIGEKKVSNGYSIVLSEFFTDSEKIYLGAKIEDKLNGSYIENVKYDIFINGNKADGGPQGMRLYYNDDGTVDILFEKNISNMKLNKENNIKIVFNKIIYQNNESVKGNWEFEFSFNRDKMESVVKRTKLNQDVVIRGEKLRLKEVITTPFKLTLKYDTNEKMNNLCWGILEEDEEINLAYSIFTEVNDETIEFNFNRGEREEVTLLIIEDFYNKNGDVKLEDTQKVKIDI